MASERRLGCRLVPRVLENIPDPLTGEGTARPVPFPSARLAPAPPSSAGMGRRLINSCDLGSLRPPVSGNERLRPRKGRGTFTSDTPGWLGGLRGWEDSPAHRRSTAPAASAPGKDIPAPQSSAGPRLIPPRGPLGCPGPSLRPAGVSTAQPRTLRTGNRFRGGCFLQLTRRGP